MSMPFKSLRCRHCEAIERRGDAMHHILLCLPPPVWRAGEAVEQLIRDEASEPIYRAPILGDPTGLRVVPARLRDQVHKQPILFAIWLEAMVVGRVARCAAW